MTRKQLCSIILVLTALIWGGAFVAQSISGDYITPYTFCCLRYFIGAAVLAPCIPLMDRAGVTSHLPKTKADRRYLLKGGILVGLFLALATICQQMGLYLGTSSGKAGFLTACYIVLVPVVGIPFGRSCPRQVWISMVIAVVGLFLLCMGGDTLSLKPQDAIVLLGALLYSFQILSIDHFVEKSDAVRLALIEFITAGLVNAIPMIIFDMSKGLASWCAMFAQPTAWISLLYVGVLSTAVAYTGQCIGQQGVPPALASLLMSFESVFAVLCGWLILGDMLTLRELAGCALIFCAVLLAQRPEKTAAA